MRVKSGATLFLGTALVLALGVAVTPSYSKTEFSPGDIRVTQASSISPSAIAQNDRHARAFGTLKLADTHSDVCLANEQQCLKACDGATSCSNQCQANYQACLSQGG